VSGVEKTMDPSTAEATLATAYGSDVHAISTGSIAEGVDCVAGCRGYYHNGDIRYNEEDNSYCVGLYEDYDSNRPVVDIPWEIGDEISLNYGNAYPLIGKIISKSENYIYINAYKTIPIMSDADLVKEKSGRKPDDLTVLVPTKPETGSVEISYFAFANGFGCKAVGTLSTAIGQDNMALDKASFITGRKNIGSFASLVGGYKNTALGPSSFAAGRNNMVSGMNGAATGEFNTVSGWCAKANGYNNQAIGGESEAGGRDTIARGDFSKTIGQGTIAEDPHQFARGRYNIIDTKKKYLDIVGNGTADNKRSNAYTLDKDGNAWFKGDVYVGGSNQEDSSKLIKGTDYASETNAGVMKVEYTTKGLYTYGEGFLAVYGASMSDIDLKDSHHKPITTDMLDYAIKVGMTTNTETLTDEEKAAACEWLGAVEKLPTATGIEKGRVYTNKYNNSTGDNTIEVDGYHQAGKFTLPTRTSNGGIYIPDAALVDPGGIPTGEIAVNKKYVDNLFEKLKAYVANLSPSLPAEEVEF
jgi:hypothetical protein